MRVGDISTQNANLAEIPVTFVCVENLGNESSFGQIENPRPRRAVSDLVDFVGWALDGEGVWHVELFVNGNSISYADHGVGQGTRPSVLAMYPGFPDSLEPVWRLRDFDTQDLTEGVHQLQVVVTDRFGDETVIGETSFFVNNVTD